jgi:hypothetical protein
MALDFDKQIQKIVAGNVEYNAANLGMGLLLTRVKSNFQRNPTDEALKEYVAEIAAFIRKYERVLTQDLNAIAKL